MLQKLNNFSSLILKLMLIIAIVLVTLWFGVSIYGNVTEGRLTNEVPDYPAIIKAPYEIRLATTGQILLAKTYSIPSTGIYILDGYYSLADNKWQWNKSVLQLNEYYFGKIVIERRTK